MREINLAEITVVSGACLIGMMGDVSQCEMNVPELMNKVIAPRYPLTVPETNWNPSEIRPPVAVVPPTFLDNLLN